MRRKPCCCCVTVATSSSSREPLLTLCVFVCMYVCRTSGDMLGYMCVFGFMCIYVCLCVCLHICMYAWRCCVLESYVGVFRLCRAKYYLTSPIRARMAADAQLASSCSSSSSSASSSSLDATDAGGSSSSSFPAYLAGETARRAAISARFSRDRMRLTPLPPSSRLALSFFFVIGVRNGSVL